MSGFPKADESDCDCFNTGHSSTSISAGLGLATARQVTGDDYHVVSVIGDGALTGGMAYEALNNASSVKGNFIIVLNDNNMSISENVGASASIFQAFAQRMHTGILRICHEFPKPYTDLRRAYGKAYQEYKEQHKAAFYSGYVL